MRTCILTLIAFSALVSVAHAQLKTTAGYFKIQPGTSLKCSGDVQVSGGTLTNNGVVTCATFSTAAAGTANGVGAWNINNNLTNLGTILDNASFNLVGTPAAVITSTGDALYILTLSKTGVNLNVTLADALKVNSSLQFSGANNKLLLGNYDLTLAATATVASTSSAKYIVTSGTGKVVKQSLGTAAFTFPVGANTSTWNPLTIANTGVVDHVGVRALPDALLGGSSGSPITSDGVAASWQLTEAVSGGSNYSVTANWLSTDELPGFLRTLCAVRRWTGTAWDASTLGAATGSGTATSPYQRVRSGITAAGTNYLAVLDGAFFSEPGLEHESFTTTPSAEANALELMPNPTTGQVMVRATMPDVVLLRVWDAQQKVIVNLADPAITDGLWLDLSQYPAGAYWVEILDSNGARLVKKALKINN